MLTFLKVIRFVSGGICIVMALSVVVVAALFMAYAEPGKTYGHDIMEKGADGEVGVLVLPICGEGEWKYCQGQPGLSPATMTLYEVCMTRQYDDNELCSWVKD